MDRSKVFTFIILVLVIGLAGMIGAQVGARQGLLDANLASDKELVVLPHMNAKIVQELIKRRPFLSLKDLDTFLGPHMNPKQRAELYGKLFIHLNLNTATQEEILAIPGMGKRMLYEFLEYRPYKSLQQFRKEIGKYVDEKEVRRLEQYVFVPINLNTAKDEDILSIPGMGPKMLHEFKEYRPYKNIEQFRREIGKYVNVKEVARLERYVTLN